MDFEYLLKRIQEWTNKVPLIVLGSGASIPFNLPSMWTLGEHLKKSITFIDADDKKQFEEFVKKLDAKKDLELALHELYLRPTVLDAIILKTWELINKQDLEAYEQFIVNKTEFPLAELTEYLLYATDKKLSIITTNYDRLAEYAASFAGAFICNGFLQNYYGEFGSQLHLSNFNVLRGFKGHVNIWKVHGSLDWFRTMDEQHIQLPLRSVIPLNLKPTIVTPGLTKHMETQLEPYRTILAQADSEIMNANGFICVGYGFNDVHVHPKLITQIKRNKPIVVLAKEITPKTKEAIINNKVKEYVLFEEVNAKDTRVYSSFSSTEEIIKDVSYWKLSEYLKLIRT